VVPDTAVSNDLKWIVDLYKAIRDLYIEKERLDKVIASLEDLQGKAGGIPATPKTGKRRPRNSMSKNAVERSARRRR
jgi:hypothetical protein